MASDEPAFADFGRLLRRALSEAMGDISLSAMAQKVRVSAPTLSRLFTGRALPSQRILESLGREAGIPPGELEKLQVELARLLPVRRTEPNEQETLFPPQLQRSRAVERRRTPVPKFGQPDPFPVATPQDLARALQAVRVWAGSPSLRQLAERSGGRLRRSSVSDMLRGASIPDYDRYIAFLRTCGIDGSDLDVWVFTWRRLKAMASPEVAAWMPGMGIGSRGAAQA